MQRHQFGVSTILVTQVGGEKGERWISKTCRRATEEIGLKRRWGLKKEIKRPNFNFGSMTRGPRDCRSQGRQGPGFPVKEYGGVLMPTFHERQKEYSLAGGGPGILTEQGGRREEPPAP